MLETTNSSDYYGNPAIAEMSEYLALLPQSLTNAFEAVKKAVKCEAPDALAYSVADKAVRLVALRCGNYEIRLRDVDFTSEKFEQTTPDTIANEGTAFQVVGCRGTQTVQKYRFLGENLFFDSSEPRFKIEAVGEPVVTQGVMVDGDFTPCPSTVPVTLTGSLPTVGERKVV